jgi:Predicted molecular chaperone distantly related to HSP70-fold metalloproteases
MNKNIQRLCDIANKSERCIIGLMSGTSVDGLDVALCRFTGTGMETGIELLEFESVPYNDDYRQEIASIFSKKNVDLEKVCLLNSWVAQVHAGMILQCLANWKRSADSIDCIASHGQTFFTRPNACTNTQNLVMPRCRLAMVTTWP